ncbi:hypothetical protein [Singulisphaera sp. PoT]|uniref:hypothetical protein n=1 Tax=Singulisphaera sp. PoT TaxID=3411797 RepID=UPI003BF5EBB7
MASETGMQYVVPRPRLLSTLGGLNVLFAVSLLFCGIGSTAYVVLAMPALGKVMKEAEQKQKANLAAKKQASLDALAERANKADTEEEKKAVEAEREAIEAQQPPPGIPGMDMMNHMGFEEPKFKAFIWADFTTGCLVNLALLASGVGLLMRRMWGIKLAIGVAVAKIVRLVLLYGYSAIEVVPVMSTKMSKAVVEMMEQQQKLQGAKGPPPEQMYETLVRIYSVMGVASAVGMIVFGAIYPIVLLWLLSRPGAKAATVEATPATPGGPGW